METPQQSKLEAHCVCSEEYKPAGSGCSKEDLTSPASSVTAFGSGTPGLRPMANLRSWVRMRRGDVFSGASFTPCAKRGLLGGGKNSEDAHECGRSQTCIT